MRFIVKAEVSEDGTSDDRIIDPVPIKSKKQKKEEQEEDMRDDDVVNRPDEFFKGKVTPLRKAIAKMRQSIDKISKAGPKGMPSLPAMKKMSSGEHFDHSQHHAALAESAKSEGHAGLHAHHAKMSDMHHEFRMAKQKREGVSGPYAGAMSSKHRGMKRQEAAGHLLQATKLHRELSGKA